MKRYILLAFTISLTTWANAQNVTIRGLPSPETVSPEILPAVIDKPIPFWNDHPKTPAKWKAWVGEIAQYSLNSLPALQREMQVTVQQKNFADIKGFVVTPKVISSENKNRILLHFHGGGYVLSPGEAGTDEAIMMAGYGKI